VGSTTRAASRWLVGGLALVAACALAPGAGAGPLDPPGYQRAFSCSACHGFAGNSRTDTTPILAGMAPWYFKKAMADYASGRRPAAEMEPFAKMVDVLGLDDVANYFAAQPRQPSPIKVDPAAVERGRAAAPSCVVCHGPAGKGDASRGVPDLAGQPPGYLRIQMLKFKADTRSPGDPTLKAAKALMATIPDTTLADLAAYYSSLR
jgi:cytochrome c553